MSPLPDTGAITADDIRRAAEAIAGRVRVTPTLELEAGVLGTPGPVVAKLELLQHAGSFKARGAMHLVGGLPEGQSVVAASGGNFGLAVAWAARETGHPATVFVPEVSSQAKREALEELGADLRVVPGFYAEALEAATAHAAEVGGAWAHAYDQPEIVAGAGTCGREFLEQVPDLDVVLVAVGGGGLIGGVATWLGSRDRPIRVIGVETTGTPTLHAAMAAGHPVDVEVSGRAADSLGARRVGSLGFAAAQAHVEQVVLVSDADVRDAQRRLWGAARILAEPGGAAAAAALMSGAGDLRPGERVGIIVCGGNTTLAGALD